MKKLKVNVKKWVMLPAITPTGSLAIQRYFAWSLAFSIIFGIGATRLSLKRDYGYFKSFL